MRASRSIVPALIRHLQTRTETHSSLTYQGGSHFRDDNRCKCHIRGLQELDFTVA